MPDRDVKSWVFWFVCLTSKSLIAYELGVSELTKFSFARGHRSWLEKHASSLFSKPRIVRVNDASPRIFLAVVAGAGFAGFDAHLTFSSCGT